MQLDDLSFRRLYNWSNLHAFLYQLRSLLVMITYWQFACESDSTNDNLETVNSLPIMINLLVERSSNWARPGLLSDYPKAALLTTLLNYDVSLYYLWFQTHDRVMMTCVHLLLLLLLRTGNSKVTGTWIGEFCTWSELSTGGFCSELCPLNCAREEASWQLSWLHFLASLSALWLVSSLAFCFSTSGKLIATQHSVICLIRSVLEVAYHGRKIIVNRWPVVMWTSSPRVENWADSTIFTV